MMPYLTLSIAVVFNVIANLLIKQGVNRLEQTKIIQISWSAVRAVFASPFLMFGVFCFGLALCAYAYSLSKINLSIVYPVFVGIGILLVSIFSAMLFKESITLWQIVGMVAILLGVFLLVQPHTI